MSEMPPLIKQVKNLLEAKAKWKSAGEPTRTPEQIENLFTICEDCPSERFMRVAPDIGRCKECGCWLKRSGVNWNKLALATEGCPLRHWPADSSDTPDTH